MTQQKLYTEEQVRHMLNGLIGERNVSDFLHRYYTPIELPSDEEIEKESSKWIAPSQAFRGGAKWMRDKILNK